jgi:Tfp pilus assembly protein FimT
VVTAHDACREQARGYKGTTGAFTLIELSVVVFIIALMVAMAVPGFVRSYNGMQLDEAARAFATTCQYARIQAVSRQCPATLHVSVEQQSFWLSQMWAEGGAAPQELVLKRVVLPSRAALVRLDRETAETAGTNDADATTIQFLPNGTCEGGTVVFRGGEKGQGLAATVDPITGKATVYAIKL